jgi:hypothetical protein
VSLLLMFMRYSLLQLPCIHWLARREHKEMGPACCGSFWNLHFLGNSFHFELWHLYVQATEQKSEEGAFIHCMDCDSAIAWIIVIASMHQFAYSTVWLVDSEQK